MVPGLYAGRHGCRLSKSLRGRMTPAGQTEGEAEMDLAIFGAQGFALGTCEALKTLCPGRTIKCFLVSEAEGNPQKLGGLPVRLVRDYAAGLSAQEKKDVQIVIATPENVQPEIEEMLENLGFIYYKRLDSVLWAELMKMFHVCMGKFRPLSVQLPGCHMPFLRIYMAVSHKDSPLKNNCQLPGYVQPLQVGMADADRRMAVLTDNVRDNISAKNGNYSELTALYWIWKNKLCKPDTEMAGKRQYYGLVQYRRMFVFSGDDLLRLVDNDIDAVLPYPMPYEPDIQAHHERYMKQDDWNALLTALEELYPDYAEDFGAVLSQKYLYNYNIILARKCVLADYCEWLFPLLERIEELSVPQGPYRSDRYIGYMGETLETLYFMRNAHKLNIVNAECRLLV